MVITPRSEETNMIDLVPSSSLMESKTDFVSLSLSSILSQFGGALGLWLGLGVIQLVQARKFITLRFVKIHFLQLTLLKKLKNKLKLFELFRQCYLHKTCQAIEFMVAEALVAANPVYKFEEVIYNPEAYIRLMHDDLLHIIKKSRKPEL